MKKLVNAGQVIHNEATMTLALRSHFHAPEWVLLPQVRNAAGFSATRTADALAMSVWPSRGLHMYGWMRGLMAELDPEVQDALRGDVTL